MAVWGTFIFSTIVSETAWLDAAYARLYLSLVLNDNISALKRAGFQVDLNWVARWLRAVPCGRGRIWQEGSRTLDRGVEVLVLFFRGTNWLIILEGYMSIHIQQCVKLIFNQLGRPYRPPELIPTMWLGSWSAPASYHNNWYNRDPDRIPENDRVQHHLLALKRPRWWDTKQFLQTAKAPDGPPCGKDCTFMVDEFVFRNSTVNSLKTVGTRVEDTMGHAS